MKLSAEAIANLENLLATCIPVGIDAIILEEGTVRGVNEDKTCVIISSVGVPELSTEIKMGLSRLSVLGNRLALFKSDPQLVVDVKENANNEASSIEISSPAAKVQFRCTSPSLIKAPKKINDSIAHKIELDYDQIPFILSGAKAVTSKKAVIASKADGVFFEFTDVNQDTFSIKVAESTGKVFVHHFPSDVFLTVLRRAINIEGKTFLNIGEVGTLSAIVNGYPLTILPQIQE